MEWYGSPSFRKSGITGYDRDKRDIQEGEKDKEQTINDKERTNKNRRQKWRHNRIQRKRQQYEDTEREERKRQNRRQRSTCTDEPNYS